jgi:4-oxalocrotonate tautomerase
MLAKRKTIHAAGPNCVPSIRPAGRSSIMPLVRISLQSGKPASYKAAIGNAVYHAMREVLNIPEGDRFQIFTEHDTTTLIADPNFMGMQRSADFVVIQIFLSRGRTTEIKQALYRRIAEHLEDSPGVRPDDILIALSEMGLDDWSFGRGEAQYVLDPPEWARKQEKLSA